MAKLSRTYCNKGSLDGKGSTTIQGNLMTTIKGPYRDKGQSTWRGPCCITGQSRWRGPYCKKGQSSAVVIKSRTGGEGPIVIKGNAQQAWGEKGGGGACFEVDTL